MQFIHSPLTWAFFLVLAPLVIHLINLMRHRRIKWAAMEFLLQSYKKHRRWIWLKQLLLLLARMLAVAAVVAMLARLVTRDQWTSIFGGKTTHHYVLLDDSFSMSDRAGSVSAFDRAKQVLGQIAARTDGEHALQRLTLLRFSRAATAPAPTAAGAASGVAGQIADLNAATIDTDFDVLLEEKRRSFDVTELDVAPGPALHLAEQLAQEASDEHSVIYLVSDFREPVWGNPGQLRGALQRLEGAGAEVHLVRCVDAQHPNLAITQLEPAAGTRAAGVPMFVDVKVKNFGPQPAERVQIKVRSTYYADPTDANAVEKLEGQTEELPAVLIDRIAAGETATRRVQVYFPAAGQHVVQATLPHDAIDADNRRWCVVDVPPGIPVLLIDGDPEGANAYYLTTVFQPGARTTTGIRPSVQPVAFLRDASPETLRQYDVIYLLDVGRLDARAVSNLESFVLGGGGLAMFLGPDSNIRFLNQWYQQGEGLFPVALDRQDLLAADAGDDVADLQVIDHPLFRVLMGKRNPFARGIRIQQYFRTAPDWSPPADSTIEVLASLRNRQPLVVKRRYGEGRVVAFLTTASPQWNNWAREPSFVVVVLQLHAYLAAPRRPQLAHLVGTPIHVQLDASQYGREVVFALPRREGLPRRLVEKPAAESPSADAAVLDFSLGGAGTEESSGRETDSSGIYDARVLSLDGQLQVRRFALNVNPPEGDLAVISTGRLASALDPVRVEIHEAEQVQYERAEAAGFPWSQVLLFALVGLLLGEQALAYSASYHVARGGTR